MTVLQCTRRPNPRDTGEEKWRERAVPDPLMTVACWAAGVLCDRFPCACVSETQSHYFIDSGP